MTYYCNYYFNSKFKCKKDEELTESTTDIPNAENDEEDRQGYKITGHVTKVTKLRYPFKVRYQSRSKMKQVQLNQFKSIYISLFLKWHAKINSF